MQFTPQPHRAMTNVAMAALVLLLAALACQADLFEQISVGGRTPRAARPPRGSDVVAPPPEQTMTTDEPPASDGAIAPPTEVARGATSASLSCTLLRTSSTPRPIRFLDARLVKHQPFSATCVQLQSTSSMKSQQPCLHRVSTVALCMICMALPTHASESPWTPRKLGSDRGTGCIGVLNTVALLTTGGTPSSQHKEGRGGDRRRRGCLWSAPCRLTHRRCCTHSSNHQSFPTVTDLNCAEEGDLRIIDRVDINGFATGSLQVYHDGAFGAVCNNQFGVVDADVACRQLGFTGGTSLPLALEAGLGSSQQRDLIELEVEVWIPCQMLQHGVTQSGRREVALGVNTYAKNLNTSRHGHRHRRAHCKHFSMCLQRLVSTATACVPPSA